MSFHPYPQYKDSGVEWLGEVPEHWSVIPLKYGYAIHSGATPKSDVADYWDGEIPWITPTELSNGYGFHISDAKRKISEAGLSSCATTLVAAGAVILSTRAPIGSIGLASELMCTNQGCKSLVPNIGQNSKFLAYLLSVSTETLNSRGKGTTFLELSTDELSSIFIPKLKLTEQSQIARFLDHETGKIDGLIAEQEQLIELLKEKRQATISHAVTKGLNPDAPMKDSGVEWLGEVPEHWDVASLKRYFISLDHKRIPLSALERGEMQGGYPYYGASGIIDYVDQYLFEEDHVLVGEDGANLLAKSTPIAFVATGKYWVNNHAHILKLSDSLNNLWAHIINNLDLTPVITGAAQPKLTAEALGNLVIACPPSHQEKILIQKHLEQEISKLDTLLTEAQRGIELLKERRSALISAAVTGKIDVRNWQPQGEAA